MIWRAFFEDTAARARASTPILRRATIVDSGKKMIHIWTKKVGESWYAAAYRAEEYLATSVESSRDKAMRRVRRDIPSREQVDVDVEETEFLSRSIAMLAALEAGDEGGKSYRLSAEDLSPAALKIYETAAKIPIGYAVTYGNIAAISGVPARVVGHAMATNPLYPIVPCHRVVGSDLRLVGYGGRQDREALLSKLGRLEAEARGLLPRRLPVDGGILELHPVEEVVWKARLELEPTGKQLSLFE